MPMMHANGVELCYESFGEVDGEPLLLVMGLGGQLIAWPERFCEGLVERGFHVVRFDNRDCGLSTRLEGTHGDFLGSFSALIQGQGAEVPYLLSDMAADAVGLLDGLGWHSAHIVGASMGGMIAQTMAIEHPDRVRSLTSIMSTTGERDVGQPTAEAMQLLLRPPAATRDEAITAAVAGRKAIGGRFYDEAEARRFAAETYDRAYEPAGTARQLLAVLASGDRAEGLRSLSVPTLVVHGDIDPLVTPSGGARTAELVPGAELLSLEGMGHDLPDCYFEQIVDAIARLAKLSASPRS
jgi:pimeloyl-ACP methyl ester carboxylesterase